MNSITCALASASLAFTFASGCSSSSSAATTTDAGPAGLKIVTTTGVPLTAAAGDALRLEVVNVTAAGESEPIAKGTTVTWTTPKTVVAEDPTDAGPNSALPTTGANATGFFVKNAFRTERTDYAGTLFVIDPGKSGSGTLAVTATVEGMGTVTASVAVTKTPAGDPDAGANLYRNVFACSDCHGDTGQGSSPSDSGVYILRGQSYPFPAPGLNNTSPGGDPNVGADPDWNAALLSMAALADVDNNGVALRLPMPDWLAATGPDGGPLTAQDFAHIYAFLKTQKK